MTQSNIRLRKPLSIAIWVAFLAVCLIWGSSYLAIRFAIETLPPFLMAGTRSLTAGIVLFTWRYLQKDALPSREEWLSATIVGVLLMVVSNGSLVWAEQWIDSGIAALLSASMPLWIVAIDAIRPGGQKPSPWAIGGTIIGFAGLIVLLGPSLPSHSSDGSFLASGVVILSAIAWAVGSLHGRDARLPESPFMATSISLQAAGVGLLILALATGDVGRLNLAAVSLKSILAWGFLTVFGSGIAFISYNWLLRAAPTPFVSMYVYINPFVALFLGHWLAAETLTPRSIAAAIIVIGSVAFTTLKQSSS